MKILKIGGSVLTKKSGYREADNANITKMAKTVASIWEKGVHDFVLVHGAGSFGHPLVVKYKIDEGVESESQKLGAADTHAACTELSSIFIHALIKEEVPAISIPPASVMELKDKRIVAFNRDIIEHYMAAGFLPVLYGDFVQDSSLGAAVCSGDQIVAFLGKDAEFAVFATDVDGVLDDKGGVIPLINSANISNITKHLRSKKGDVTGAMEGKIRELLILDNPSYIVNANYPERIVDLMLGKKGVTCTEVMKDMKMQEFDR
ncbi:isopentenyl phosphate kinase family protein [Candidatus Micrarchaeota archaeon]|nr:isopentenyl phosphate kinase family protein [Candidatus Micrarchaeota archaeon]